MVDSVYVDVAKQQCLDCLDSFSLRQLGEQVPQILIRFQVIGLLSANYLGRLDQAVKVGTRLDALLEYD